MQESDMPIAVELACERIVVANEELVRASATAIQLGNLDQAVELLNEIVRASFMSGALAGFQIVRQRMQEVMP
jgi:hypothetical protein